MREQDRTNDRYSDRYSVAERRRSDSRPRHVRLSGLLGFLIGAYLLASGMEARSQPGDRPDDRPDDGVAQEFDEAKNRPWYDGTTLEQRQAARRIFLEGNRLIALPDFAGAAEKYRAAIAVWDNPVFHYNLVVAQVNLVQPIGAYQSLQRALRHDGAALEALQRRQASKYMDLLEKQIARVEIVCEEPGTAVTLDGKRLFRGPDRQTVVVAPGTHQVVAAKDGFSTAIQQVVGNAGQITRIAIAPIPPDRQVKVRRWKRVWLPWSIAGAGAFLLTGAAYLDRRSTGSFEQYDADVAETCRMLGCGVNEIPASLEEQLSSARDQQWAARATYAVAAATLATGGLLMYLNRERTLLVSESAAASRVALAPMISRDGLGVAVSMNF